MKITKLWLPVQFANKCVLHVLKNILYLFLFKNRDVESFFPMLPISPNAYRKFNSLKTKFSHFPPDSFITHILPFDFQPLSVRNLDQNNFVKKKKVLRVHTYILKALSPGE